MDTEKFLKTILPVLVLLLAACPAAAVNIEDYENLQAAIDANPGRMIFVPAGEYALSEALRITADDTGLYGYGTIIQENPDAPVLFAEKAGGVRIKDLTFTRAPGTMESAAEGIRFDHCRNLILDGVRVRGCKSRRPAICLRQCNESTVRNCEVIDYKRIAVDDRTASPEYGYAFFCIDGTGIAGENCEGLKVQDNRILEYALMPDRETKEKYRLGSLTEGAYPEKFGALGERTVGKKRYVNNWHQGSALMLSRCDNVTVAGNYLRNCAQGIDVHGDNTVIANNTVYCSMMGVKLTHGSRNIIVDANLLRRIDLWAILLNPGTGSNYARDASADAPAMPANVDGGTVISNNIVTEYGFGNEFWNWGGRSGSARSGSYPIALFEAQLEDEPPLRNVLIEGNMVYDTGRDKIIADGKAVEEPPRYRFAVYIGSWREGEKSVTLPRDIVFGKNLFHPGVAGVANVPFDSLAPEK
jgi:parallel beta-helix repeat protein